MNIINKFIRLVFEKKPFKTKWLFVLLLLFLFIKFSPIVFAHDPAETDLESNIFYNMIEEKQLTPSIVLIGLLIATVLGALHGLSPGHGKSIVAAYLVGTQCTLKHALFLGVTVTFTHTFGVFALGLIALFASGYILPEQLYPYLSILSGTIVFIIGSVLFIKRIIPFFQKINHNRKYHTDDHEHNHQSSHGHQHSHRDFFSTNDHYKNISSSYFHHDKLKFHHSHRHSNGHLHLSSTKDGSSITWRSLLPLGISAGILPCPSAFVVLLGAISMHRIGFGLLLIVGFSLGLAGVLTGLGLFFVKARNLLDRIPSSGFVINIIPLASASLIMILGAGIIIKILSKV